MGVGRIRSRSIYESNDPEQPPDKVLGGYLSLLHAILDISPDLKEGAEELVVDIFGYIFDLPG